MDTLLSRARAMARATFNLLAGLSLVMLAGCAGEVLTGTTLAVQESIGVPQPEGTLILMELIAPLKRERTLTRFPPADLRLAGLEESEVRDGSAVFASPWRQRGRTRLAPGVGVFALVSSKLLPSLNSGASPCGPTGRCSFGGDAVAIRVIRGGPQPLYEVDSIVEARTAKGDCYYVATAGREVLYCKSLEAKGWVMEEGLFVKLPGAPGSR